MALYLNFISTISAATGCNVWVKTVHTPVHLTAPADGPLLSGVRQWPGNEPVSDVTLQ